MTILHPNIAPHAEWVENAHITLSDYRRMYQQSIDDPELFWASMAERFEWVKRWDKVKNTRFEGDVSIRWFEGAKLNITSNCIDRHVKATPDRTAIIWEGDSPDQQQHISYATLLSEVCKLANALKELGVKKGDRVTIYLPMIPQAAYAMLACARIGAIHSIVFGGFSPEALRGRIEDCASEVIITADEGRRGGKTVPLKDNADKACANLPSVKHMIVYRNTQSEITWKENRDHDYERIVNAQSDWCEAEVMDAEDPLFILYTSGSTGKPKGVLHTTAGYMVYSAITTYYSFNLLPDDIYWCTADIGWVTGHSYMIYGPLANGATTLLFEGVPTYPDASRFWQVVDKHKVSVFYTAPTAIRALMQQGDEFLNGTDRSSLRILASVGEPINPEAWEWYYRAVGNSRCPVIDTWWQTETGGHMITSIPAVGDLKPGYAGLPFFGIRPILCTEKGEEITGEGSGLLCIADSWPSQMRSIYGDHQRFIQTYFSTVKGTYFTGDGALRDGDGYYRITGRIDDVLNISGHRLGTAEIEAALNEHPAISESAVVGYPHDIKGQGIYAYVQRHSHVDIDEATLKKELIDVVKDIIGPIAKPDHIHITSGLPKTRSGKIMRRILRKIAENDYAQLGDISTLLNPECVEDLIKNRLNT